LSRSHRSTGAAKPKKIEKTFPPPKKKINRNKKEKKMEKEKQENASKAHPFIQGVKLSGNDGNANGGAVAFYPSHCRGAEV